MRNWIKKFRRNPDPVTSFAPVTVRNHYRRPVAVLSDNRWSVSPPPPLRCTGATATGSELRLWAARHGLSLNFAADPDLRFAQLEGSDAVQFALWLKRFNADTGYDYRPESRDCDNFSRRFRAASDLFAGPVAAQRAVFGIYAAMSQPFAGVSDGRHALNAVWTDSGVFVFEPQGLDLIYQRLEDWPNRTGITAALTD